MTYSNRLVGGLVPGRLASFIPVVFAASALGTGGCSIDFSAACAPGQACHDGRTTRKGVAGEIAPVETGGTGGFASDGSPAASDAAGREDAGAAAGGSATTPPDSDFAGPMGGAAGATDDVAGSGGDAGASGGSAACPAGFQDCNGDPADGCEVNTLTNADNCGACGNACSTNNVRARFCVAGTCAPTCLNYHADCVSDDNDGCETSLAGPWHCGGCGHDCGAGACLRDGQCGAVNIASSVKGVSRVVVTPDHVYWPELSDDDSKTTVHGVWRVDGQRSPRSFETARRLMDFAAVGDELYVTFAATGSTPLDGAVAHWVPGAPPEDVVTGIAPAFVAATTDGVYWTDIVDKSVYRAGRNGEHPKRVTGAGDLPFPMTANGDTVFGATTGGLVFRANATEGVALRSALPVVSAFVAVDGPNVFAWTSDGQGGRLGRYDAKLSTGPTTILTEPTADSLGRGLAAAGGEVFFARTDGIYRIAESGGEPRLLVATTGVVPELVASEHTLYWVELAPDRETGSVRSVNFYQ